MPSFHFTKMHGLGNDIVIVDADLHPIEWQADWIRALADRHTGIGFDQLLTVKKQASDFFCRIYNPDGSEAEQCGNGLRCVARFLETRKKTMPQALYTKSGKYPVSFHDDEISIDMGQPLESITQQSVKMTNGDVMPFSCVNLGNPHAIIRVPKLEEYDIASLGEAISTHSMFKDGMNVGFSEKMDDHTIRLRTFERGAGLTLACGSNASAAAVIGIQEGYLKSPVTIHFERGALEISLDAKNGVIMKGPAMFCYDGIITS